jgi:hypothetical protein
MLSIAAFARLKAGLNYALLGGLLSLAAGCATVQQPQVEAFHQGVSAAKVQLDTAFASINRMVTQDEIDRAITLPNLKDEDVIAVLDADSIARWDTAFAKIDQYAANLTLLISPDNAKDFGTATQGLADAIATLSPNSLPSPTLSTAFAEFGRILIEVKGQHDAVAAARTADPGIQKVFSEMAAVIGESSQGAGSLRGTLRSHWQLRMDDKRADFLAVQGEARRSVVTNYIALRDQRDAQDLQLGMLRQSILDLAAAHGALARGSNIDLNSAVALIQQELDATRALAEHFQSLQSQGQ